LKHYENLFVPELETAYEVFMNTQGNIPTTELPLIFNALGISLSESELEKSTKDAVGMNALLNSFHTAIVLILVFRKLW